MLPIQPNMAPYINLAKLPYLKGQSSHQLKLVPYRNKKELLELMKDGNDQLCLISERCKLSHITGLKLKSSSSLLCAMGGNFLNVPIFGMFESNSIQMNKNTSISLGNYFDQFVQSSISEGSFKNVSEVIRAGLRL